MKRPPDYQEKVSEIRNKLKTQTISEIESNMGISKLDYTGVGFGYNLKSHRPKTIKEAFKDIKVKL